MHVGAITCMGKRQTDPRPSLPLPLSPEGPHPMLIEILIEILGYTRDQISPVTKQMSADRGVARVGRKGLRDGKQGSACLRRANGSRERGFVNFRLSTFGRRASWE